MNPLPILILGVIGFVAVVTAGGWMLGRVRGPDDPLARNVRARIDAWWGMGLVLALAMLAGRWGIILLFLALSFAALREFVTLIHRERADHWAFVAVFFVVLPVQYLWVGLEERILYTIFIPVYGFLLAPIASVFGGKTDQFLERIAGTQWATMLCIYCLSHVAALVTLDVPGFEGREVLLVAFLFLVVQGSDAAQFAVGIAFGRRSMGEALPSKRTWEGFAAAMVWALVVGAGLWWITPFNPLEAGLIGVLLALMGFFGRLVMAGIKRGHGVRAWSHGVMSYGGMLDRLDSVIFAAPVFYHVVRWGWAA